MCDQNQKKVKVMGLHGEFVIQKVKKLFYHRIHQRTDGLNITPHCLQLQSKSRRLPYYQVLTFTEF